MISTHQFSPVCSVGSRLWLCAGRLSSSTSNRTHNFFIELSLCTGLGILVPVKGSSIQFCASVQLCGNSLEKNHIWSSIHIFLAIY